MSAVELLMVILIVIAAIIELIIKLALVALPIVGIFFLIKHW